MNGVIVVLVLKTIQKDIAPIDLRIKDRIPVYIGVNNDRRRGRKNDPIIKNCNTQGGVAYILFRNEDMG